MAGATIRGIHLFVRDVAASVAFYRTLGIEFDAHGGHFARARSDRAALELGSFELTRGYDPNFREPAGGGRGGGTALQVGLDAREAVDAMYETLTARGAPAHLAPFDAYWGSRYAEVLDPDGNIVGLQSPRDPSRITPPPA